MNVSPRDLPGILLSSVWLNNFTFVAGNWFLDLEDLLFSEWLHFDLFIPLVWILFWGSWFGDTWFLALWRRPWLGFCFDGSHWVCSALGSLSSVRPVSETLRVSSSFSLSIQTLCSSGQQSLPSEAVRIKCWETSSYFLATLFSEVSKEIVWRWVPEMPPDRIWSKPTKRNCSLTCSALLWDFVFLPNSLLVSYM